MKLQLWIAIPFALSGVVNAQDRLQPVPIDGDKSGRKVLRINPLDLPKPPFKFPDFSLLGVNHLKFSNFYKRIRTGGSYFETDDFKLLNRHTAACSSLTTGLEEGSLSIEDLKEYRAKVVAISAAFKAKEADAENTQAKLDKILAEIEKLRTDRLPDRPDPYRKLVARDAYWAQTYLEFAQETEALSKGKLKSYERKLEKLEAKRAAALKKGKGVFPKRDGDYYQKKLQEFNADITDDLKG